MGDAELDAIRARRIAEMQASRAAVCVVPLEGRRAWPERQCCIGKTSGARISEYGYEAF